MPESTSSQPMSPISKKMAILIGIGLTTTLFGGVLVMLYLGLFTTVEVHRDQVPSYRLATLPAIGAYGNIKPILAEVERELEKANIEVGTPCSLFLDDTSKVKEADRKSMIGYLVKYNDYLPGSLEETIVPSREVIVANFEGGTKLGSYKAYEAMKGWAKRHGFTLSLPALEIYHPDGRTEYHLTVQKKSSIEVAPIE